MTAPPTAVPRARTALSVLLLAVLYLWVFPFHNAVNNPNENVRVYMTVAIVDDHTFAINRIENAWGYVNDKAVRLGRLYSSKAPGTSYLGVPVYWLYTRITHTDSRAAPPPRPGAPPHRPVDRTRVIYFLRLFGNVLPGLLFGWFWHRFLAARTTSATLREAIFFGTMAGSSLFAYSLVYASHAQNAFCFGAALMALASLRRTDAAGSSAWRLGTSFLAGLFGAGATLFEYPAAIASFAVALWILATAAERRRAALWAVPMFLGAAGFVAHKHHIKPALALGLAAFAAYAVTLRWRGAARLVAAGAGGAIPAALVLFYHQRCFGDPFKPGYSFLENPSFREETNQGFFGATQFSWEAALRMWFDPAFGFFPTTPVLLLAVAGLGVSLVPEVPVRPGMLSRRTVLSVLLAGATVYAASRVVVVARTFMQPDFHAHFGPWICALVVAVGALAAVRLPRPVGVDRALGATSALAIVGMTHLIGMMNNWRGGWQVGPRYLVTLVPALGALALVGGQAMIDAAERDRDVLRRALVTTFAGGGCVAAMLLTGSASAWFPHIPLEYGAPFFEMSVPLVRAGFVPHNAGHLLGGVGPRTMAPFFFAAAAAALLAAMGDGERLPRRLGHLLGAAAVTLLLLVPSALAYRPETAAVTRYVRSAFEPRPAELASPAAAPAHETATQAAERARRLGEEGQSQAALDAWLRAIRGGAMAAGVRP